jgi:phosphoglycerol transferase
LLLIFLAGMLALLKKPQKEILVNVSFTLGLTFLFFFINFLPTLIYTNRYGINLNTTVRQPSETELYGLKIAQLILPFEDHNLGIFNKIQKRYIAYGSINNNENQGAALGSVGAVGFLFLITWLFFRFNWIKKDDKLAQKLDILATMNLALVLFATVGSFASLLSTFITPTFRSVNRVSVFISFLALVTIGLLVQKIKFKYLGLFVILIILPLALFDQISLGVMRNFMRESTDYQKLVTYAKQVEDAAGNEAKIYTLPLGEYPEGSDKKLMRIALLTNNIQWSTGAEKLRASNYWQTQVESLEERPFLESIIKEGFTGLVLNTREMLPEKVEKIEKEIGSSPIRDSKKEYYFYDLRNYALTNKINRQAKDVLFYVAGNCLYATTKDYYCSKSARIEFENLIDNSMPKVLKLTLLLPDGKEEMITKEIMMPTGKSEYILDKDTSALTFSIPPTVPIWPLNLGYPNFIIKKIELN